MEMGVEGRGHFHESSGKSTCGSPGSRLEGEAWLLCTYPRASTDSTGEGWSGTELSRGSQTFIPYTTQFLVKGARGMSITPRGLVLETRG